ncbi:nucleotidyltransferase family protein [bacterium]|nr:nucleotidyltransferase family protein [bacterium]
MNDRHLLFCLNMVNEDSKASAMARWTEVEWNELVRQSGKHGLSAYLYARLKILRPVPAIPPAIEQRFKEITLQNASKNIRLYHVLGRALTALRDNGISAILLKGAHLAAAVYSTIAQRRMGDVDILVKGHDLQKAVDCLIHLGFQVMDEDPARYLKRTAGTEYHVFPEAKHFFDLIHPDWKIRLDVHVSLSPETSSFSVDTNGLWCRAVGSDAEGVDFLVLSPIDSILYQCIHESFHHQFSLFGLRPMCDMAETIRKYRTEVNWDELRLRSQRWKAEKCVWLTLQIAKELIGAGVPDDLLTALKPKTVDSGMVAWVKEQIFQGQSEARALPKDLIRLWKSDRVLDKAETFRRAVFPSRQVMAVMYPVSPHSLRVYLYYPVRIKDLLFRWGRTALRLMLREKQALSIMERENREIALKRWLSSSDSKEKVG